jgi:hypothetical protein
MKKIFHFPLIVVLSLIFVSCSSQQSTSTSTATLPDDQLASQTLVNFLESLHAGKYAEAAQLYGGTYETMLDHNPDIDPKDHSSLMQYACTINGAQCLQVKSAVLDKIVSDTEFLFKVDFMNEDGTLFVLGPCCGGNETDSPPQSVFYFTVIKDDQSKFTVRDMPPYAP